MIIIDGDSDISHTFSVKGIILKENAISQGPCDKDVSFLIEKTVYVQRHNFEIT